MRTRLTNFAIHFFLAISIGPAMPDTATGQVSKEDYLSFVQSFADQLLTKAKDQIGPVRSDLWASVLRADSGQARLWAADSLRTRRAIEGLRFHFRGLQKQSYLYNRHAHWNVVEPGRSTELLPGRL